MNIEEEYIDGEKWLHDKAARETPASLDFSNMISPGNKRLRKSRMEALRGIKRMDHYQELMTEALAEYALGGRYSVIMERAYEELRKQYMHAHEQGLFDDSHA